MTHTSRWGTISQVDMLRVAMASITSMATAVFSAGGAASADPAPTQVITTVAVGPNGQPINGYQEAPTQGNVFEVSDCTTPSQSAVADNIYYCSPSAAGAGTCWPSTPGSLLCADNPWDKSLHRVTYDDSLPPVQATATPDPIALALDDGTHCLLRNGGAWGGRDDSYVGGLLVRRPQDELRGPMPSGPGCRNQHRSLGAGLDGQGRSTGQPDQPLSAASDPRGDERVVRRKLRCSSTRRVSSR